MSKYRSFKEAKKFVHSLKLKSRQNWVTFCKSGKKPKDIPNWPDAVYKNDGWVSWNDFLGTNNVATYLRKYRTFIDAKKYVHKLKIRNQTEWRIFAKSNKLPKDIPRDPPTVYKKEWLGWADWLRGGKKIEKITKFLPFAEAREFVRKLGLKGQKDWQQNYLKSGNKPENIPASPQTVYKKEWLGWGDWVGSNRISNNDRSYRKFEDAREFVRKLNLTSYTEWIEYRKSEKRPADIPSMPERVYKNQGWRGYGDFLGTGRGSKMIFWEFEKAREFIQKLKIETKEKFVELYKNRKIPPEIPKNPPTAYKKEWKGWGDFLGTGRIANQKKDYLNPKDALPIFRKLAIEYGLKNKKDWDQFAKTHKNLLEKLRIPAYPLHVYSKENVWRKMK